MITVNCQSSIKIVDDKTIYIDPLKVENTHDADYIFITHTHWDHFSIEDITNIKKENTTIIGPFDMKRDCLALGFSESQILIMKPYQKVKLETINVQTIPAYNLAKEYHPKRNNWLGYLLVINNTTYYIAGDTDVLEENERISCDVAFLPIGGTYTMTATEAASFINKIKPKKVIPVHYGLVVGSKENVMELRKLVSQEIQIEDIIAYPAA